MKDVKVHIRIPKAEHLINLLLGRAGEFTSHEFVCLLGLMICWIPFRPMTNCFTDSLV